MKPGGRNEIEIKLPVADIRKVQRRLRELRAVRGARVHEVNAVFDTPEQTLRRQGQLLRVRVERGAAGRKKHGQATGRDVSDKRGDQRARACVERLVFPEGRVQRALVTLKAPVGEAAMDEFEATQGRSEGATGYKVRREIEFAVEDGGAFREVLQKLGFAPVFYYEKLRTHYRLPRLRGVVVTLDETPIGTFLELEGEPGAIDRARQMLGYRAEQAILLSYGGLNAAYRRSRGLGEGDMLFE